MWVAKVPCQPRLAVAPSSTLGANRPLHCHEGARVRRSGYFVKLARRVTEMVRLPEWWKAMPMPHARSAGSIFLRRLLNE